MEIFSCCRFHILFLFFVSAMFALSVTSLFSYHLYLVSKNRTTLEAFRTPIFRGGSGPDKLAFHLGVYNNFQANMNPPTQIKYFLARELSVWEL